MKRLGDDLDSRSTPSLKDGKTDAQEMETSCPGHLAEKGAPSMLGSGPALFLLVPEVFAP